MRQGLLIGFLKKIIWRGKRAILGLKTVRPHNFGSAVRGFFEVQESKRYKEIMLVVLLKKNLI